MQSNPIPIRCNEIERKKKRRKMYILSTIHNLQVLLIAFRITHFYPYKEFTNEQFMHAYWNSRISNSIECTLYFISFHNSFAFFFASKESNEETREQKKRVNKIVSSVGRSSVCWCVCEWFSFFLEFFFCCHEFLFRLSSSVLHSMSQEL